MTLAPKYASSIASSYESVGSVTASVTSRGLALITPSTSVQMWISCASNSVPKIEALRAYGKELEPWPHPRSERGVRSLAEYRGSQISAPLAEAFEIVRIVH